MIGAKMAVKLDPSAALPRRYRQRHTELVSISILHEELPDSVITLRRRAVY